MFTLAAEYPFLNILWTMIIFFFWVAWIMILIRIISDVFRRQDASGWTKALWIFFVIILPFIGVLVYLVVNAEGIAVRDAKHAQAREAEFADYVQSVAPKGGGSASEIEKAKGLLDSGAITRPEFESLKAKALAV